MWGEGGGERDSQLHSPSSGTVNLMMQIELFKFNSCNGFQSLILTMHLKIYVHFMLNWKNIYCPLLNCTIEKRHII